MSNMSKKTPRIGNQGGPAPVPPSSKLPHENLRNTPPQGIHTGQSHGQLPKTGKKG